jgi:hypothetical protein
MGDEAGESQAVTDQAIKSRSSIWKSAIVIAPLAATALFLATGTQAQTSGSTAPSNTSAASTSVTPIDAPAAARRKGPKERDEVPTNRTVGPATTPDPVTETQTAGPPATDAQSAARVLKPRRKAEHGQTATTPAPADAPAVERRKEGPKGDGSSDAASGRKEAPAPDTLPAGRRKGGAKAAAGSGRTATTPLIIGALGGAAVLALEVSGRNGRPASP